MFGAALGEDRRAPHCPGGGTAPRLPHRCLLGQPRRSPQAGLQLKKVASHGSCLAPSPHVATGWTGAAPSPPATLHTRAAFCPLPGNPDSGFAPLNHSTHAGQVWAPEQENKWKEEAKPVWPVLCANTIIHDSGSESETKVRGGPGSCQTSLLRDNSMGPASLGPHTARALQLPVTRDQLSTPHSSKVPSKSGASLRPVCSRPHKPNSTTCPPVTPWRPGEDCLPPAPLYCLAGQTSSILFQAV